MNFSSRLTLYLGAFSTMALSNAVVPILPGITADVSAQGLLYAAYFLGAFLTVLPAGRLSDKTGRTPLIRIGLAGTFIVSVLLYLVYPDLWLSVLLRGLEGIFTGIFGAAALACVNSEPDHLRLSGIYIALLNIGMVAGLIITGFLTSLHPYAGILLFGLLTGAAALLSLRFHDARFTPASLSLQKIIQVSAYHFWLWLGILLFTGATGIIISTYPALSGYSAGITGLLTAFMSLATAAAVFLASRCTFNNPLAILRLAAVCLALTVPLVIYSPLGLILAGAVYGLINAAAMDYIATTTQPQGVMNGLFLLTQYGGMSLMPVIAGFLIPSLGYLPVFLLTGLAIVIGGLTIVRCPCYISRRLV